MNVYFFIWGLDGDLVRVDYEGLEELEPPTTLDSEDIELFSDVNQLVII